MATTIAACGQVRTRPALAPMAPPPVAHAPHGAPGTGSDDLGCVSHPAIDAWEDRLRVQHPYRASTLTAVSRGQRHLGRVRAIVVEEGLPAGLAYLPVIESSFAVNAGGRGGARGLWQLRAPTARRFGLVVDRRRDDRLHPERATRAAARYLRLLHDRYDDWPLALAAYNAGEGRVDRALLRFPGASFWELAAAGKLPRISRDYVPRFLAVLRLVAAESSC